MEQKCQQQQQQQQQLASEIVVYDSAKNLGEMFVLKAWSARSSFQLVVIRKKTLSARGRAANPGEPSALSKRSERQINCVDEYHG